MIVKDLERIVEHCTVFVCLCLCVSVCVCVCVSVCVWCVFWGYVQTISHNMFCV